MSDCYRDDGTGTEDWGVTRITEQVAAWEPIPAMGAPNRAMLYYRLRTAAEALRPLAALLQEHNSTGDDALPIFAINSAKITLGDLRNARAVLAALEKEGLA